MAFWYPGYEQIRVRFADNRIPMALASSLRSANARSVRFVGLYSEAQGDVQTPQNRLRARMVKTAKAA